MSRREFTILKKCPNCGCTLDIKEKKPVYKKIWFWILMIILVIVLIFGLEMVRFMKGTCFSEVKKYAKMNKSDFIKTCEEYDPDTCRNDSEFIGKPIKVDLRIDFREGKFYFANAKDKAEEQELLDFQEETYDSDDFLIWQGEEFVLWNYGECKMLKDDIITIYGIYAGESKVFMKVPYPTISVLYFEKLK